MVFDYTDKEGKMKKAICRSCGHFISEGVCLVGEFQLVEATLKLFKCKEFKRRSKDDLLATPGKR